MSRTQEILARLVAFDTVSERANLDLIAYAQDLLATAGARVERLDDPDLPKAGLVARIGPEGRGALLSAHTDVVPEGAGWTRDPFRLTRDGDRLHGRGTTDMKGFLASALAAAERAGTLAAPLTLLLSYDEEVGCKGLAAMRDRLDLTARLAIVGEPTSLRVVTGHKGKRAWRAEVRGEAGHSSLAPRYVNAISVAADLVRGLQGLQTSLERSGARDEAYDVPWSTVHVGRFEGGGALNVVPDRAVVNFELRHLALDDADALERTIDTLARDVVARHGAPAEITLSPLIRYPGLDQQDDALVGTVAALAGTETGKVAYGTEAGLLADMGLPVVVCGPGDMEGQGHKADEFIEAAELARCDAMLDRLVETLR